MLSALAIPLGFGIAVIHEFGYFDALGLPQAWQFAVILPIPLSELLRIIVLAILMVVTGLSLVVFLIFTAFPLTFILGKCLILLFHELTEAIPGAQKLFANAHEKWKEICRRDEIIMPHVTTEQANPYVSFLASTLLLLVRIFLLIGLLKLLGRLVLPGILLILDKVYGLPSTSYILFLGIFFTLSFALFLYAALWVISGKRPRGIFLPALSKIQNFALLFSWLSIGIFCIAFDVGHDAGLMAQGIYQGEYNERQTFAVDKQCASLNNPTLLRSYSNGYLLLSEGQLGWMPVDDGPCWTISLHPVKLHPVMITPTWLGKPIDSMKFRVFRPVKAENDK